MHPASVMMIRLAKMTCFIFMCYGAGVVGVIVGINVSVGIAVGGTGESVTMKMMVSVGMGVAEAVLVLKGGMTVMPGVLVGTLGT